MSEIIIGVIVGLVIYQAYITVRVARSESYTISQKWRQTLLIWLLPFAGAAITQAFLTADREIPVRPDKDFVPQEPNDRG